MNKETQSPFDVWYDLMVDNRILVSIRGKDTAEWFLKNMSSGKTKNAYTLRRKASKPDISIDDIKAVEPW